MAENWIKGAIKNPGALRRTAIRMGLIGKDGKLTQEIISRLKNSDDPETRQRANLASTLMRLNK